MKFPSLIASCACGFALFLSAAFALGVSPTPGAADVPKESAKSAADRAWDRLSEPVGDVTSQRQAEAKWGADSAGVWRWIGELKQQRFQRGLEFWDQFPDDIRRYYWFRDMVLGGPFFWADMEQGAQAYATLHPFAAVIDEKAKMAWRARRMRMRMEYLSAPQVDEALSVTLRGDELGQKINEARDAMDGGQPIDLVALANEILDLAREKVGAEAEDSAQVEAESLANSLLRLVERDPAMEAAVIKAMQSSPRSGLNWLANGREQVIRLRGEPFDLRLRTLDGTEIDLATLRGRVVLLDFWAITCSGCIQSLPLIQAAYARHHAQGFDVIGVCFEEEKSKAKVEALLTKLKITFPQTLQGARLATSPLTKKLGIYGFPTYFLLGRDGLLVTNDVHGELLEREVKRLLDTPGGPPAPAAMP